MKVYRIVVLVFVFLVGCGGADKPLADLFAEQVGSMRLTHLVTGEEAMRAVHELHGKPLDVEEAAVATYSVPGADQAAMVWVSRHDNAAQAREQAAVMIEKMLHPLAGAPTPFHDPEQFRYAGVDVYAFQGMGLTHLVFQHRDRVWWISAPGQAQDQDSPAGLLLEAMLAAAEE